MKPSRPTESKPKAKQKRRHRSRPTPKWLMKPAEGPEAVAQRRCLLVLSVLSGEQPVTDAIETTGVSRQLYYQLEEKALRGMLRALLPSAENSETVEYSLQGQLAVAQARVKQLETEKRRAERLLLLTRKLVRPGPVKVGPGRPRKTRPNSRTRGPGLSTNGATSQATPSPVASSPAPTSETLP